MAEQLFFRFRSASAELEARAISWQVKRELRAEVMCGNQLASQHPSKFIEKKMASYKAQDCTADLIVEMYKAAALAGCLDEGIWSEEMYKRPRWLTIDLD